MMDKTQSIGYKANLSQQPKISVIVPVFTTESCLRRCIESILGQTYQSIELILVDDGSFSPCPEICDEYAKKDMRVLVIHKENEGVSAARNRGIEAATGEYVTFCDSDDYWGENWLSKLYGAMKLREVDLVSGDFIRVSEEGKQIQECIHGKGFFSIVSFTEKKDFIVNLLMTKGIGWEVCTKLFVRSIIQRERISFCETCENFAEDMGFVLTYLIYCQTVSTSDTEEYYYVQHTGSMMANSKARIKLNALNEVSKSFGLRWLSIKKKQKVTKEYALLHFLIMNNQYNEIFKQEKYSSLGEELAKIKDKKWYRKYTWKALTAKNVFEEYYDKKYVKKIKLFLLYCLHGNWTMHKYISGFFYKFLY